MLASSGVAVDLFFVWWLDVWTVIASTGRRELETVDGKWEILIIWIVDKESVVN